MAHSVQYRDASRLSECVQHSKNKQINILGVTGGVLRQCAIKRPGGSG